MKRQSTSLDRFAELFTTAYLGWPIMGPPDPMMIFDDCREPMSDAECEVINLHNAFNRTDPNHDTVQQSWACVNACSARGRPTEPKLHTQVNQDTKFKVQKASRINTFVRGKFSTPYQLHVYTDEGDYEVSMKFIEEIAQSSEDALKFFIDRCPLDILSFWKAVYWELWCLEGVGEKHHIRMVNAIDGKSPPRTLPGGASVYGGTGPNPF
jgi:hypothetical protein